NMVTGDYSRGASGFWIENGKRTYPVSEVTIAGHLIEMFRSLTPANDLEFRYGINAPTLRVEGLTVAGPSFPLAPSATGDRDARRRGDRPRDRARSSQTLDQGCRPFAGDRGRHRGQPVPARSPLGPGARGRMEVRGVSRRTARPCRTACVDSRSDRWHPRLYFRKRRLVHFRCPRRARPTVDRGHLRTRDRRDVSRFARVRRYA